MHTSVFNTCLLIGWFLVLVGGFILNPGAGLVGGGVLLILLALVATRLAGGLYGDDKEVEGA